MAETEKSKNAEGEGEDQPAPKKSKRKLIIFAVIGVVVLALIGGGAFFMLKKKKGGEEGDGTEQSAEAADKDAKAHEAPPVYVKLEPFTTNMAAEPPGQAPDTADHYIQVTVELKVDDAKTGEELKNYMPEIRNNILRLLSSKRPSQLTTTEGKDGLANEIRDSVNAILNPGSHGKAAQGPVQTVLFSSFIIQ